MREFAMLAFNSVCLIGCFAISKNFPTFAVLAGFCLGLISAAIRDALE